MFRLGNEFVWAVVIVLALLWAAVPVALHGQAATGIRGVVYVDFNGNGQRDAADPGQAGVTVATGEGEARITSVSDGAGSYVLAVGVGQYVLMCERATGNMSSAWRCGNVTAPTASANVALAPVRLFLPAIMGGAA